MRNRSRALIGLPGVMVVLVAVLSAPLVVHATDASPSPGESPSAPQGVAPAAAARIDELIASVPALRALEPLARVPYRAIDGETFQLQLQALFDEEYPPELVAAEEAAFKRLGLLSPEDDLERLILGLLADQALAYYDPRTGTITFVGQIDEIGPIESLIVVHEYGHALQDQRWDLEGTRETDPSRSDRILAQTALTEGDATLLMYEWAAQNLKLGDLIKISERALSRADEKLLERLPPLLRRQLVEFPYIDGYAFVSSVRGRGESWQAVDQAWDARPVSTEQILHPERYPTDVPVEIELTDVAALLGEGWTTTYEQTLGEMQMGVWVADGRKPRQLFGLPGKLPVAEAVAGWGGDRLVSLDGRDGAWAILWQTAWDSDRDADQFVAAAKRAMKDLDGAHAVLEHDIVAGIPSPVLVLVADSKGTLAYLRERLGTG